MFTQKRERGTILIVVMIAVFIVAGMAAALLHVAMTQTRSVEMSWANAKTVELAESGIDVARAELIVQSGNNGQAIADGVNSAGNVSDAARWNASTNAWVAQSTMLTWSATSDDVGLDGVAGTGDFGEGDGFPTPPDPAQTTKPGEPNVIAFRLGAANNVGASDTHYWTTYAKWWGNDGVDNNKDGTVDTDAFEQRTYTIRAAGIYADQYTELETFVTRDPPQPPIDPNNPPLGFLAAISIQISANSGAPAGFVNLKNTSSANVITGNDSATSIVGAQAASSTNNTSGVLLAASGASLALSSDNPSAVSGTGGTPSFNNNGTFIGDIIDSIADGVKKVAVSTTGTASTNATNQSLGSTTSLKLVYHDADTHGPLMIGDPSPSAPYVGVSGPGFGILVVDVASVSSQPALAFAGSSSRWEGIVIVRVKNDLAPSGPQGAVKATGSGSQPGQIGSVVVYAKGTANFSGGNAYMNNGNRPTQFSLGAVKAALSAFNTAVPPTTNASVTAPLSWRPIRSSGMRRVATGE